MFCIPIFAHSQAGGQRVVGHEAEPRASFRRTHIYPYLSFAYGHIRTFAHYIELSLPSI